MAEPMITIKKADGTFAKVPLSEFKKIQANQQKQSEIAKTVQFMPHSAPKHHQAAQNAIKHNPVHIKEEKKTAHQHHTKHTSRVDVGSLLEEKLKVKSSTPLFSPRREKQVEEVLKRIGFTVAPEMLGRLKSLILSRLKDLKSEDEIREIFTSSIKNGGLGLTQQQVEKIIKSCFEVQNEEGITEIPVPILKGEMKSLSLMVEPEEIPAVPSTVAAWPYNKIRETILAQNGPLQNQSVPQKETTVSKPKEDVVSKLVRNNLQNEPIFKLDTRPAIKQSMQDISASNIEMGPVDEIKSITLVDFRRLSSNPEEAAKRLQQKMINLQEESFVWYLEALAAYHSSPLYKEYMQAVSQSLAERKSLANVLSIKNGIKLNEAMALIEMEKGL